MKKSKLDLVGNLKEICVKMGFGSVINPIRKSYNLYFHTLKKHCMTTIGFPVISQGEKETVGLEDIYVPLKLREFNQETYLAGETEREIEAGTAVDNNQLLLILGEPGIGKTTLLKYLTLTYCNENIEKHNQKDYNYNRIPIPISLREFFESGNCLRNYINSVFKKYRFPRAALSVEKNLKAGHYILMLDGLDELVNRNNLAKVINEVFTFLDTYPGCRMIMTSRTSGCHGEMLGFKWFEIVEFDDNQVIGLVNNRFSSSNCGKAEAMLQSLNDNEDLKILGKNPLILSIITGLFEKSNEILPKRASIYKRIIDVLMVEWDAQKKVEARFSPDEKRFFLSKLAFLIQCRHRRTITEKEILEEIARYSLLLGLKEEEYKPFLEEIWQRSYLLRKLFINTYEFLHLSFQDYFTALELKERENGVAMAIPHLSDSGWEEPILLYAGVSTDAGPLIKGIQKQSDDIFFSNLIFSGKCLAEVGTVDPLLKEEIVHELWLLYISGEFLLLREKAVAVLSRIKPRRITDMLVEQLTDKETHIRKSAAEKLGAIAGAEVLPILIMVLVKEKESKIRSQAALALGKIGDCQAIPPLIGVLHTDEDNEVRKSAAEALGLIGSNEALPELIKVLTAEKDNQVRIGAAEALGKIRGDMTISQLIRTFDLEKDCTVRWRIAMSLGKLGGIDARDVLIKALSTDRHREVRESAAEGLGLIGGKQSVTPLIRALTSDKDADVRGSAAYALGFMRTNEALPDLIKTLITDADGEVRGRAAYALGQLRGLEAVPYLTVVFNTHKASFIRGNATYALGQIGGVEAIPFLTQALAFDKDSYVRFRAAEVLGMIGDRMTIPPLKTALTDEGSYYGWKVRDKAFEALEQISRRLQVRIFKDYG